jgi:hypothetical protein
LVEKFVHNHEIHASTPNPAQYRNTDPAATLPHQSIKLISADSPEDFVYQAFVQ